MLVFEEKWENLSLRKQPTVREATAGFPREMTSKKQARKFHTDDVST